jgi:hypothetical protein
MHLEPSMHPAKGYEGLPQSYFQLHFRGSGVSCRERLAERLYQSQYQLCQAQNARQQELCEVTREALKTAMLACKQSR